MSMKHNAMTYTSVTNNGNAAFVIVLFLTTWLLLGCSKSPGQDDTMEPPETKKRQDKTNALEREEDIPNIFTAQESESYNSNNENKPSIKKFGTILGKYHNEHDYDEYLDIRSDGTLYWRKDELGRRIPDGYIERACKWRKDGSEIMIIGPQDEVTRGTIQTNGINVGGKLWIRHEEIAQKDKVISDMIPGRYILKVESEGRLEMISNPLLLSDDGKIIELINGTWRMAADRVTLCQGINEDKTLDIVDDTLGGLNKTEGAERLVEKQLNIALWSDYVSLERFVPPIDVEFNIDGTYSGGSSSAVGGFLHFGGKWEVHDDKITLSDYVTRLTGKSGYELQKAQVTQDCIEGLAVLKTTGRRTFSEFTIPRLVKQTEAWPVTRVKSRDIVLWSRYVLSEDDGESEVVQFANDGTFQYKAVKADGSFVQDYSFGGKWSRKGVRIDLSSMRNHITDTDTYIGSWSGHGRVLADHLMNEDFSIRAKCLKKCQDASLLAQETKKVILWSSYGSTLELKKDGTFSRKVAIGTWKVENSLVIIKLNKGDWSSRRYLYNLRSKKVDNKDIEFTSWVDGNGYVVRFTRQPQVGSDVFASANGSGVAESTVVARLSQIMMACSRYHDNHFQYPPSLQTLVDLNYLPSDVIESPRKPNGFDGPSIIYIAGQHSELRNVIAYENPKFLKNKEPFYVLLGDTGMGTQGRAISQVIRHAALITSIHQGIGPQVYAMSQENLFKSIEATYFNLHKEMPEPNALGFDVPICHVRDYEGVIEDGKEDTMNEMLRGLKENTQVHLSILTVYTTDGLQIDQFAGEWANKWNLQQKSKGRWIFFVLAMRDKQYRFEVADGLQEFIPVCMKVGDEILRPLLKQGEYSDAITKTISELERCISDKYHASRSQEK